VDGTVRTRSKVVGHARFNTVGDFNPNYPHRMIDKVFECDEPSDFMHLMLTLRDSEASRYTERDTPIFVGQHVSIRSALDALDGASARVEA